MIRSIGPGELSELAAAGLGDDELGEASELYRAKGAPRLKTHRALTGQDEKLMIMNKSN